MNSKLAICWSRKVGLTQIEEATIIDLFLKKVLKMVLRLRRDLIMTGIRDTIIRKLIKETMGFL